MVAQSSLVQSPTSELDSLLEQIEILPTPDRETLISELSEVQLTLLWQRTEIRECRRSFRYALQFWQFRDREGTGVHTFANLWPGQEQLAEVMECARWIVDLKAGKQGHSELECAYDWWASWAGPPSNRVHIFSNGADEAREFLEIVRFGLMHLPRWFGVTLLAQEPGGDTLSSLRYRMGPDDVRTIVAYPAKPKVSISQSSWHAHIDEAAHMMHGREVYDAVSTTISDGGSLHVVSRGAGPDDQMARLWLEYGAMGLTDYARKHAEAMADVQAGNLKRVVPVFVPYTGRPGRDADWFAEESARLSASAMRHYAPATPEDALSGDAEGAFIDIGAWDALEVLGPLADGDRTSLVIALDAGGVSANAAADADHFALVATSRHPERNDEVAVRLAIEWLPPVALADVRDFVRSLKARFNVVCVCYDPYQLADMAQQLQGEIWMDAFEQGKRRMIADKGLRDAIQQRRLSRIDHPGLRDAIEFAGVQTYRDEQALRIVKRVAGKKIDMCVALSMSRDQTLALNL